jgi:hypothetical protein
VRISTNDLAEVRPAWLDGRAGWAALAGMLALFVASWPLVGAGADVPIIDDWVYAWSVEHILATGDLRVLDISAIYPVAHILWGAAFARVAGFSFASLRMSTVALAVIGCWSVYLTLRELNCRRSTGVLGALALALHPLYFALSFSFMTEIPFISLSALALWSYVRAVHRDDTAAFWLGGLFSIVAFLVRPVAILLPLSVLPVLMWRCPERAGGSRFRPLAAALTTMVVLQVALPRVFGPLDWAAMRWEYLQWWFMVTPTEYLQWNVNVTFVSLFPLVPLLLPCAARSRTALAVAVAALAWFGLCRWLLGALSMPLPDWQTWSLQDIAARALIGGQLVTSGWSARAVPIVKIVGLLAVASMTVVSISRLFAPPRWSRPEVVVVMLAILHVGAINLLWLYNDRYYLALAPPLVIVAAKALDTDLRAKRLAAVCLALWAGIALSGTRDMLTFTESCAKAARQLEASGIPAWDVDAGYALNGWRLYAHPENLPPGAERNADVPFVTSAGQTRYIVTNTPLPHADVVRVIPLDGASWQATHAIYVVHRRQLD